MNHHGWRPTEFLTKWTEPSMKEMLTPPGWLLVGHMPLVALLAAEGVVVVRVDRGRIRGKQVGIDVLFPGVGIGPGQPLEVAPVLHTRSGSPGRPAPPPGPARWDSSGHRRGPNWCSTSCASLSGLLPEPSFTSDSLTAAVFDVPSVMLASVTFTLALVLESDARRWCSSTIGRDTSSTSTGCRSAAGRLPLVFGESPGSSTFRGCPVFAT